MFDSINGINSIANPQENSFEAKAIEQAQRPVKKIEDEIKLSSKAISGLGQWKTHLESLKSTLSEFSSGRFGSNNVFDRKKVIGYEYDKYAKIKAKPGTTNQQIPFEIISLAKSQIIETTEKFKPDDQIAKQLTNKNRDNVSITVIDNGLKIGNVEKGFTVKSGAVFSPGKFTIGNSAKIELKDGDSLQDIVNKINNITKEYGEEQNPHVIATVEENRQGKEYIWIRSDEKHHGIQNKFEISGNAISNQNIRQKNDKIKVDFDDNTKIKDFISKLRHSAKKANIEVIYNPQYNNKTNQTEGTILLKSLITGSENEIQIDNNFKKLFSNNNNLNELQNAEDARIKVNEQEITSKTNRVETNDLTIELINKPTINNTFNISVENDTTGLIEKFEKLAEKYNKFSEFVTINSLQVEDPEVYSKPADIASLHNFKEELNSINEQMYNLFNKLNQFTGYRSAGETSDLGIGIQTREDVTYPSTKTEDGKEQNYIPITIYEMVVDKDKLKNAIEENFDTFKEVLSYQFESTNDDFKLVHNNKNIDFKSNNVQNLDYSIDYSQIRYFSNVSQSGSASDKINRNLNEKSFFVINNSKIYVDKNTTYSSLVDEINNYSKQTNIKAYLISGNQILSTSNPSGSSPKIALGLSDDNSSSPSQILESQNDLRSYLSLADPLGTLNGIFSKQANGLDANQKQPLIDYKIPQITLYDTSKIASVSANLNNNSIEELPCYLELSDHNKLESGGTVKILPKILNGNKKIDLENFEVAYFSNNKGSSTILAKQGIIDKITNLINEYTKFGGSIDNFTRLEEQDKSHKQHTLTYEKQAYQYKKAQIERDYHKIRAQEMKTKTQQEFFKQLNRHGEL